MAMRAVTKIEIQCQRRRPYHETVKIEFKTENDIGNDSQNESGPAAGIETQIESLHENKLKPKLELERKSKAKRRFKPKPWSIDTTENETPTDSKSATDYQTPNVKIANVKNCMKINGKWWDNKTQNDYEIETQYQSEPRRWR